MTIRRSPELKMKLLVFFFFKKKDEMPADQSLRFLPRQGQLVLH